MKVLQRKVLDHVTSPKYTQRPRLHPNNLIYPINPRALFISNKLWDDPGRRKEEPADKIQEMCTVWTSLETCAAPSQVLLGTAQLWRLSQKCPHKPQPPDSWRRSGRTCPGTLGCQFRLQHPFLFQWKCLKVEAEIRWDGFRFHLKHNVLKAHFKTCKKSEACCPPAGQIAWKRNDHNQTQCQVPPLKPIEKRPQIASLSLIFNNWTPPSTSRRLVLILVQRKCTETDDLEGNTVVVYV